MRFVIDVLGIFRFMSVCTDAEQTVEAYLEQLCQEFGRLYQLAFSPRFVQISRYTVSTEPVSLSVTVGGAFSNGERIKATPDERWCDRLRRTPWTILGLDDSEFDTRIELLRKIYGDQCNTSVLGSCLLRASGNLSKATAICSFLRPETLNNSRRVTFVRPREDLHRRAETPSGSGKDSRKVKV
ncbi:hypothetical protein GMRT_10213 [Giardia muris]|uniref:Uncharacterized protein n=1 Tax=Giardia muris TaxID=5742 RepID=A0A4Z1SUH6_GIAMU|nr:hypothetical protein GMRT_10213 [Giardia muris]|eukprot:TNJ29494.1 hypothetical protein GMRT_10213 [Giardia muris]